MPRTRVLVVDDEQDMLDVCADVLEKLPQAEVQLESQGQRALDRLARESFDLVLTDIRMPRVGGLEIVRAARERDADVAILVFTAHPSIESAVEAVTLGANDYIAKPFLPEDLLRTAARLLEARKLRDENQLLERQLRKDYGFDDLVGASPPMQAVFETIRRVAAIEADVLILGETGTGKELVARSIHKRSSRRSNRFVPVDCGAIPEELLESELFGHERGAFTGRQCPQPRPPRVRPPGNALPGRSGRALPAPAGEAAACAAGTQDQARRRPGRDLRRRAGGGRDLPHAR